MSEQQKDYKAPEIRELGSVTELTQTGQTKPGQDVKSGSMPSNGI